ncbi:MAG TPA: hypothetical protein VL175_09200 [Pirellulales bacterium]|jgi:hypothetical protein|nr:hypothetical protein [Pirellulales bacterium]
MSEGPAISRALAPSERALVRWMLENGEPNGVNFLPQLDAAQVGPWVCPCGCASFNLEIKDRPTPAPGGMKSLGAFVFEVDGETCGIFVYERHGVLAGVEVTGYTGDAPKSLPEINLLRPAFPKISD